MYFVSIDSGNTWQSSRSATLYKVKAFVTNLPSVQPGIPLYIAMRDAKGEIRPMLKGEKRDKRYVWSEIVVMNQPLQTVR